MFKNSEIREELDNVQLGFRLDEMGGMHVEEVPADEAEGYRDGFLRDVRSCLAARRRNDCRGRLVRSVATDAIFSKDPVEAYLAWQFTDGWGSYREGEYPDRYESLDESPLVPKDGLPDGYVGPGDALEYGLPNWEAIEAARESLAEKRKEEAEDYHCHLRELAQAFGRYCAPEVLAFVKQNKFVLLDLLWQTDDHRKRSRARPTLPDVKIAETREDIERYLDDLVVAPAVRASHGDPSEARRRVREALRLFCNGGEVPEGKTKPRRHVKGFGLDPKVLIKASQLEQKFQRRLDEYHLREEIWQVALERLKPKAAQLIHSNPKSSFAEKVIAGVIHSFPRKWKQERIGGQVVFHPADWDEKGARGPVELRTKPLIDWAYLLGSFDTTADAVRFLASPETQESLKLLGPNWVEELKRIVFGAYKRSRQD